MEAWILKPSKEAQVPLGSWYSWWCCRGMLLPSLGLEGALNLNLTLGWNVCHWSCGFTGQEQKVATAPSFMATSLSKFFALLNYFGAGLSGSVWLNKLGFRGSLGPASSSYKAGSRNPWESGVLCSPFSHNGSGPRRCPVLPSESVPDSLRACLAWSS